MNDQEQTRDDAEQQFRDEMDKLVANIKWFNQFFGGMRQLYGIVVETLPTGFFPDNFALAAKTSIFLSKTLPQLSRPTMC